MSFRSTAAAIFGCLVLSQAAVAQQPARLATSMAGLNDANRATLEKALFEFENSAFERSGTHLQQLLQARPDAGLVRALRAYANGNITAAERNRELDRAVQDAAKASTAELVLAASIRDRAAGRTPAALTLLDAAQQLLPDESLIAVLRVLYTINDPVAGPKNAEAGHAKFADNAGLHNLLAYQRYESGSKPEGLALAAEYVKMVPEHPNSHDTYAELLHRDGDLAAAEREYRRALELDPTFFAAHYGLAEVALSRGDTHTARAEIEAALPKAAEPIARLGVLVTAAYAAALDQDVVAMRRNANQAIAGWEAAGLPPYVYVRDAPFELAFMEAAAGNRREAEAAFNKVQTFTPPGSYSGLGRVMLFSLLGDKAQMDAGVAEMERSAAERGHTGYYPQAVHLARAIRAAASGDLAMAQREFAQVEYPGYRVMGNGYLAKALERGKDRAGADQARAEMQGYNEFDWYRTVGLLAMR
ncbi:MAG: tetratricopeptide repeat protein [Gemmatimonadetes bacterium]|nr:tetratricopeptide repeat protein [Gemmatimonadota bacterium]